MNVQQLMALAAFSLFGLILINAAKAISKLSSPLVKTNGNKGCNKLWLFTQAE